MSIWDKHFPPSNETPPANESDPPNGGQKPKKPPGHERLNLGGATVERETPEMRFSRHVDRYLRDVLPGAEQEAESLLNQLRTFKDPRFQEQLIEKWKSFTIISDAATLARTSGVASQERLDAKRDEIIESLQSAEEMRDILRCMNDAFLKAEKNPETAIQLLEAEARVHDREVDDLERRNAPRDRIDHARLHAKRFYAAANKIDDLRRYAR